MILIGLTGGISCGKSTVSSFLRRHDDVEVIDADQIVHDLQRPNSAAVLAIKKLWPEVVDTDGVLDRAKLGDIAFKDRKARAQLAGIMNWRVFLETMRRLLTIWWSSKRRCLIVLDMPLLFETVVFSKLCSKTIVVYCSDELEKSRLMARDGVSSEDADRRIAAQMPLEKKRRLADYVIDNSTTLPQLESNVHKAVHWARGQTPSLLPVVLCGCTAVAALLLSVISFRVATRVYNQK